MRLFKTTYWVPILLLVFTIGCAEHTVLRPNFIIDKTKVEQLINRHDTTYILFWTNWCDSSKRACNNQFIPLAKQLKQKHKHCNVILIAADAAIPEAEIIKHREHGIHSYYLHNPGNFALFNRLRIKSFLNYCFPNQPLECIDGIFYTTPVKLMVTHKELITNPTEILTAINAKSPPPLP